MPFSRRKKTSSPSEIRGLCCIWRSPSGLDAASWSLSLIPDR